MELQVPFFLSFFLSFFPSFLSFVLSFFSFCWFPLLLKVYLKIISAVLGVGQMTLCLLTPRAVPALMYLSLILVFVNHE